MGSIIPSGKDITVEFSIDELGRRPVIVHLPKGPPPDKELFSVRDIIGNMIIRSAFEIIYEKMPIDKIGKYDSVQVTGGPIKIRFYNKEG